MASSLESTAWPLGTPRPGPLRRETRRRRGVPPPARRIPRPEPGARAPLPPFRRVALDELRPAPGLAGRKADARRPPRPAAVRASGPGRARYGVCAPSSRTRGRSRDRRERDTFATGTVPGQVRASREQAAVPLERGQHRRHVVAGVVGVQRDAQVAVTRRGDDVLGRERLDERGHAVGGGRTRARPRRAPGASPPDRRAPRPRPRSSSFSALTAADVSATPISFISSIPATPA